MTTDRVNPVSWHFDHSYARLPKILFTATTPAPVLKPSVVIFNHALAHQIGLNFNTVSSDEIAALFSGNTLPHGAEPIALAYAGHQYGYFTMLGDGRALLLGEQLTPDNKRVDIQLKGSGPTPYSRHSDGRAALGPMLREYIISETMFALRIPTTRSLAVIATGESVYRETETPGAILTRVAASHIRIGTFEYLAAQEEWSALKILVEYTIDRHYPDVKSMDNPTLALLNAVIDRHINLIIEWMRVGFIHGVMNTDNMAISGETIDYGPCAFIDEYDPNAVFSSIDTMGRYAYSNQPKIAQWNLARFAECLLPLLHTEPETAFVLASESIAAIDTLYQARWLTMMRKKLGLLDEDINDVHLINELLNWMFVNKQDYTNTFLALSESMLENDVYQTPEFQDWHQRWQYRLKQNNTSEIDSLKLMRANNPAVIPRNHQVERVLHAAIRSNDFAPLNNLLKALANPYENTAELHYYQNPPNSNEKITQTFCGT